MIKQLLYSYIFALLFSSCDKKPETKPMVAPLADHILKEFASQNIFFGHQSVGNSLVNSISRNMGDRIKVVDVRDLIIIDSSAFIHGKIGENGDPKSKIDDFKNILLDGLGGKIDIAMMKFCYVDFSGNTDIKDLLKYYSDAIDDIQNIYPELKIVHFTAPLTTKTKGIKGMIKLLLGKDGNIQRNAYNKLLRYTFPENTVFDIAGFESIDPFGKVNQYNGNQSALCEAYTTDGGHLNVFGADYVTNELIEFIVSNL